MFIKILTDSEQELFWLFFFVVVAVYLYTANSTIGGNTIINVASMFLLPSMISSMTCSIYFITKKERGSSTLFPNYICIVFLANINSLTLPALLSFGTLLLQFGLTVVVLFLLLQWDFYLSHWGPPNHKFRCNINTGIHKSAWTSLAVEGRQSTHHYFCLVRQ